MITTTNSRIHRAPRLAAAALVCLGTVALSPAAAHADPGKDQSQGQSEGQSQGQSEAQSEQAPANDPAGNNGTVKIAPFGEVDSIPNNTPHVGCTFQVEWYGFDEGADIVSTVSFESQAPTADAVIGGTEPSQVFVGGDPASGAGTDDGLDGRQAYTLSFTGEPHPQQGFHVKLTITTPGSIGNDTKSKVFWVEGCAPTGGSTPTPTPTPTPETETPGTETPGTETPGTQTPGTQTPGTQTPGTQTPETQTPETQTPEQGPDVLGEQAFGNQGNQGNQSNQGNQGNQQAPQSSLPQQQQSLPQSQQQELPTAVNAGAPSSADEGPVRAATSLLGLLLVLLGAVSARLAWIRARG